MIKELTASVPSAVQIKVVALPLHKLSMRTWLEKLAYIVLDHDTEMKEASKSSDGNAYTVGSARLRCPEVLPQLSAAERRQTAPNIIFLSIMKCDVDIRKDLCTASGRLVAPPRLPVSVSA